MKVSISSYCLLAVFILAYSGGVSAQRIEDICVIFSNNTVIRDPESCSRSITCINSKSVYSTCKGSTPFFDKNTLKCVKVLEGSDDCDVSCEGATTTYLSDPKSCFGYYYCADDKTPMYGSCPDKSHFNYTTQQCTWKFESECNTTTFDYCSIIKNGVNFDNAHGCNRYHVCTKGVLEDKTCKTGYYRASTGTCVAKTLVNCNAHPLPANVCGTARSPKKNARVPDGATCGGYFFCEEQKDGKPDPNPRWSKCPPNLFFDKSSQTCKEPNKVACSEDRCQGRTLPFVLSSTKGCRHYLRCGDDRTIDEKSCGNYFFDEANAVCVSHILKYDIC